MIKDRLTRVVNKMKEEGLRQILVSDPVSISYLTAVSIDPGERLFALLVKEDGKHEFFINHLFPAPITDIPITSFDDTDDSIALLANALIKDATLAIDKVWPARFLLPLQAKEGVGTCVLSDIIDLVRAIKDEAEKEEMRIASKINDEAMKKTAKYAKLGMTEIELADFLRQTYLDLGCEGPSFEPIVAFGEHAADPHHENSARTLKAGDVVLLDIGGRLGDYCSDMTRTYFTVEPSKKQVEVYELVRAANEAAIKAVKPGVALKDIDKAARDIISKGGYGKEFTHRLGHFIGREVHEYGDVSSVSELVATPGMIFSIEPGIYLPGEFGVRIEDLVIVTEDGCENLNAVSKDIQILDIDQ